MSFMETMFIMNNISKVESSFFDMLIPFALALLVQLILKADFKNVLKDHYYNIKHYLNQRFNKTNVILISNRAICESSRGVNNYNYCPIRYKAIMHYLSKINNNSIYRLQQYDTFKFDRNDDNINEDIMPLYRVAQNTKFKMDDDIYGKVYTEYERIKTFDNDVYDSEIIYLELSSKLPLNELQNWIHEKTKEYKKLIREKSCDTQSLIEISCNPTKNKLVVNKNPWSSNCDFSNRFFTDKDRIINIIDTFLNKEELYKKRGIPHTLGFLLWGEPGCGKTGFIKALMNRTKRHGISIKLNNKFDLNKLRQILYSEEITDELCIPLNKRIIIFEDIDCMSDIVKTRFNDSEENESDNDDEQQSRNKDKEDKEAENPLLKLLSPLKPTPVEFINNNLSYLLNILDGLEEYPGRIIIMTSNQPDKLDKALIRPGRIDHIIEFTNATIDDIKNIIIYYWNCDKILTTEQLKYLDDLLTKNNDLDKKYSHAHIVNICRSTNTFEDCLVKLISDISKSG